MFVQRRLSGIARQLNGLIKNFEDFREEHPTLIAPNVLNAIIGNLKDDVNVVMREMNMVGSPNRKQLKARRYHCRACHNVFMQPLVAGICDECRGRGITSADIAAAEEKANEENTPEPAAEAHTEPESQPEENVEVESPADVSLENLPMIGEEQAGADPFSPGYFQKQPDGEPEIPDSADDPKS